MTIHDFFNTLRQEQKAGFGNYPVKHCSGSFVLGGRADASSFELDAFGYKAAHLQKDVNDITVNELIEKLEGFFMSCNSPYDLGLPVLFDGKTVVDINMYNDGYHFQTVSDPKIYMENQTTWKQMLFKNGATATELPAPHLAAEYAYYLVEQTR